MQAVYRAVLGHIFLQVLVKFWSAVDDWLAREQSRRSHVYIFEE